MLSNELFGREKFLSDVMDLCCGFDGGEMKEELED
jgi:hypothetical protein